jgi:ABC-type nitrate/sulfonate/bicarbonate transport system ATPase subunit
VNEIRLNHITKAYPIGSAVHTVFSDLDLEIPLGKITVLVGRSGCGKSTLLRLLGGLEQPQSGSISMPEDFHTAMLYPEPYLISWTSVHNNVKMSTSAGLTPDQREEIALRMTRLVGLTEYAELTPLQLSTGMKQRLALARALAGRAEVLLMDEPFASLDFITRAELQRELLRIQRELPRTIVFVTHQLDEAVEMADRIVVLPGSGAALSVAMDDLKRPRDPDSPEFLRRKQEVMAACMR